MSKLCLFLGVLILFWLVFGTNAAKSGEEKKLMSQANLRELMISMIAPEQTWESNEQFNMTQM